MATIITVYKQPRLVELILRAMQHEGSHFYLHIDRKVDIKSYEYLADFPNTFFLKKRLDIKWASYSMVEVLLMGMEQALQSGIPYDFINHISGQCYPIKPIHSIFKFFDQHKGNNFLRCEPEPSDWWSGAKMRYEQYHLQDAGFKGSYRLSRILTTLLPKRKLPFCDTLYGGPYGAYWTISLEAAAYLIAYLRNHTRVRKFFKMSWGPDEFLFNTLIMNSPLKDTVINDNYRHIDWSAGGWHPKILTSKDYPSLLQSDCFFARKFDLSVDKRILELIDKNILT